MRRASAITRRPILTGAARIIDVALVLVVAIGLVGVVVGRVLPLLGHPVYVVAGPSMEPTIGVGAAIVLEAVPAGDLEVGDVVSLRSGEGRAIFTHRIIRVAARDGETWLETQGDANAAPDPSITNASAVIGRVAWSLPAAGYLIALLSTVPGLVLLVSTGVLLLVAGWWLESLMPARRTARVARSAARGAVRRPARARS